MTKMICRQCGQWAIKNTDDYCGYCGFLQLPISIEPLNLTLISDIVTEGKVVFRNDGAKDLDVEILPLNHSLDVLTFLPSNAFTLVSEDSMEINIQLEEERLPKDLALKELKFVCMINNDQRKTIEISINVKAGPNPVALIDEIRFGDVEEGKDADSKAEIMNRGGVPLQIKNVTVEGSSQFQVKLPKQVEPLNPNEKIIIPVIWKSPKNDPSASLDNRRLRVQFKNSSKELFIPIKGTLFKLQFAAEPAQIRIDEALALHSYTREVTLVNNGNRDIEVTAIETGQEWIQIVSKARSFTLLCQDSINRKAVTGPTRFPGNYTFEVLLLPEKLEKGINKGKITVQTRNAKSPLEIDVQLDVIPPKKCNDYIGIDFGTSNSVVAIWDDEITDIRLIEEYDPKMNKETPLIPSVLAFKGRKDNYKIGAEAEREERIYPDMTVRSIKRVMGYGNDREFFGKKFSPEDLAALIIKKLVEYAEEKLYKIHKGRQNAYPRINKAIVTVPANFYDLQIRGILEACNDAGIDTEEKQSRKAAVKMKHKDGHDVTTGIILDEPSAAALFYLSKFQEDEERRKFKETFVTKMASDETAQFLVYDHGGGTLDVSVVQVEKLSDKDIGIKVLANKGGNTIGGDSIDVAIMRHLVKHFKEKNPAFDDSLISANFKDLVDRRKRENWDREVWRDVLGARFMWKDAAERLKIALDEKLDAKFTFNEKKKKSIFSIINGNPKYTADTYQEKVTRNDVVKWLQEILNKSQSVVREALAVANLKANQIDFIIHTGRSSLLPAIRDKVKLVFPQLPKDHDILDKEYLKICVAKGAALYGLMHAGIEKGQGVRLVSGGRRLPHGYGVQVMRGFVPYFESIIDIGEKYPTVGTKTYEEKEIPRSGVLNLKFLQNSGNDMKIKGNQEIRVIGSMIIDTLADKKPGCDIKFIIDANRKMEVTADGVPVEIEPVRLEERERWIG